jgi:hypothetical protein
VPEPREYARSDWIDEVIDGLEELSYTLSDSLGIMQLHLFKAQLDVLDGFKLATQRYVDFLEQRYQEPDEAPAPTTENTDSPLPRSKARRRPERLWPIEESGGASQAGQRDPDTADDEELSAPPNPLDPDGGIFFRSVEPQRPGK